VSKVSALLMIDTFEVFLIRDSIYTTCGRNSYAVSFLNSWCTGVDCPLLRIHQLNSKSNLTHSVRFPCQHYSPHAQSDSAHVGPCRATATTAAINDTEIASVTEHWHRLHSELWSLHPCTYPKAVWIWSWATGSGWSCLSRGSDLMSPRGALQPQPVCDPAMSYTNTHILPHILFKQYINTTLLFD